MHVMTVDTATRTWVVAQAHPHADDQGPGSVDCPLQTINAAATQAGPGDTVLVHAGVYRERVAPRRSGTPEAPITFRAAPGEAVAIRGSDVFAPAWEQEADGVVSASLPLAQFGTQAYRGVCDEAVNGRFNPYACTFKRSVPARPQAAAADHQRGVIANFEEAVIKADSSGTGRVGVERKLRAAERDLAALLDPEDPCLPRTLGQVFVAGQPVQEVERRSEMAVPGTWMVSACGTRLLVRPPAGCDIATTLVEITTRHACFSPLQRGLGHIKVQGFVIEHGANHTPSWGEDGWSQAGLLSCRSGHHWTITGCTVRHAKGIGLDCGQEGGSENMECPALPGGVKHQPEECAGHHLIADNDILDNGHCGIAGIRSWGVRIIGNRVERNNCDGWTSPWWEFAGIKMHFFFDGLIEGNLVRDNEAHGIWLDNQFAGSRVTRNCIVNNLWSGVNVELGRGPVTIDNNVIALTRSGDGIYGHDVSDVLVAHNLLYRNAQHGLWMAYCTPRVKPEDGCWQIKVRNNIVAGNQAAIGLSVPWSAAGDNESSGNLLMGHGQSLDEGSGPFAPRFVITNRSHCGAIPEIAPNDDPQTTEVVVAKIRAALEAADIPAERWPNLERWDEHFSLPLDCWQACGFDVDARVFSTIRDAYHSRSHTWSIILDEDAIEARCEPIAGLDRDYYGKPLGAHPRPGPFQDLRLGGNRMLCWPVIQ